MSLNANKLPKGTGNGNKVEQPVIDPGMYPGRIVQILDLGLQAQRPYQGKEKPPANEIMITYELVDVFMIDADGKELEDAPRWISETVPLYSIDQEKAKSTQRYLAADPDMKYGGDFSLIVDAPVNISLVQNKVGDKVYVNIGATAPMRQRDADKCPALKNPPKVFDLDSPDMEVFGSLPQWVQDKIKNNLNFKGSKLEACLSGKAPEVVEAGEVEDNAPWA